MKIISWNVNGIRACAQKGLWKYWQEQRPDIFCVQETKAHPEQIEPDLLCPEPVLNYWSSALKRGYSGVATFTRSEPQSVEYGIGIRKFDSEGRFVVSDHGAFVLYNVYFPNGGSGPDRHAFKQQFLERFLQHLLRVSRTREVIVVGDYNIAHKHHDIYDPIKLAGESGFLPEERAWMDQFLSAGFVDSFRWMHPDEKNRYTWWSYQERARVTNRGWRIDYICLTSPLSKRLKRAEIHDDIEGSDHCPVCIELDL